MTVRPGHRFTGAALAIASLAILPVLGTPAHAADALYAEGFESGSLARVQSSGDVSIVGAEGPIAPAEGSSMLRLGTGDAAVGGTTSSAQFAVAVPPQLLTTGITVSARYNFVSEEYPEYVNSAYNDTATLDLQLGNGTTLNLLTESVNEAVFTPVAVSYPGGDETAGQTGWRTAQVTVTPEQLAGAAGGVLAVRDQADGAYDTVLLLDDVKVFAGPAFDCGDGFVIGQDEVPTLVAWVGASTELTATEQAALEAQPCSFLAYFGDVEQDPAPAPATTEVAGPGAPIGSYAAPARETPETCPLYAREVKLTVGQGFQLEILPGDQRARDLIRRALNHIWRQFGNEGPAPTQFAQGDVLLSLKLSLRVCTDGSRITAIDPPAGGSPGYEAIATAKGQAVGYKPPAGLLAFSHGYIDTGGQTTFKSRAEVAFDYGLPGNVDLPVDIEFRAKKFAAEITVYKDGTWDYALSGGGTLG